MLDQETKKRIDSARDVLVGKVPDPKAQVEQITIALIYKFMDDMDKESVNIGGKPRFFTGDYEEYSWTNIMSPNTGGHARLNLYGEAITKMSLNANLPQLFRDIFNGAYLPYRDAETLNLFLKEINGFSYDHSERLGDAFEYLLSVLGSQGDAGQFRTPRHIIEFMAQVVDPQKNETILDPACGTAGFLISAYKHILNANKDKSPGDKLTPDEKKRMMSNIVGYDISPDMVRLSRVNMYLHGFPIPQISEYDTLTSEQKWDETFDVILANPPFMTPKGGIRPHKRFSVQAKRSEVLFVDYMAEHLNKNGRAGIIVPEGIIFQAGTAYKQLRKMLVDEGYLYAVVSLPVGVFQPYTGVKTTILFLDKQRAKRSDHILFVEIVNDGTDLGAQRKKIKGSDLPVALSIFKEYNRLYDQGINIDDFKKVLTSNLTYKLAQLVLKKQIIEKGDYNLTSARYRKRELLENCDFNMVFLSSLIEECTDRVKGEELPVWSVSNTLGFALSSEYFEKDVPSKDKKNYKKVQPKHFAYNPSRINVGSIALNRKQEVGCVSPMYVIFKVKDRAIVNEVFLFKLIKSNYFSEEVKRMSQGAVRQQLKFKDLCSIQVPLPSFKVQEKIVAEVAVYQKIIDGAVQVIENYKPEISVNSEWEKVRLDDVCEVKAGGTPSRSVKEYWNGDIPWYSSGELNNLYTIDPKEMITKKGLESSSAAMFPNGSLLIGMYDTAAFKMSILDRDACFNQAVCGVKPNDSVDLYFLYLYFTGNREEYLAQRVGVRQRNLNKGFIASLLIPLPSIKIQKDIVQRSESENLLVESNQELIKIFEQKIQDKLKNVWGEK